MGAMMQDVSRAGDVVPNPTRARGDVAARHGAAQPEAHRTGSELMTADPM